MPAASASSATPVPPERLVGRRGSFAGRGRLNVTALLAVVALADVVLVRATGKLLLPNAALAPATNAALAALGRFTTNLAGALAFFVFVTVLVRALTRSDLFPRPLRLSLLVVAIVFMALAASALVVSPLSDRQFLHARTAQAFLALFACVIASRGTAPRSAKLVVALFAAPMVLGALALFCDRVAWSIGRIHPADLLRGGEFAALAAAASSPLLVWRDQNRSPSALLVAPLLAVVAATGVVAAMLLKPAIVQMVAMHAFRMDVPPLSSLLGLAQLGAIVLAVLGMTFAVALGLAGSPSRRLTVYGLVLIATGSYQPANAPQILLSITGLFALAIATRAEPDARR